TPAAVRVIQQGGMKLATVMIGANDVGAYLGQLNPSNPASFNPLPFVQALATNVHDTVDALRAAGNVRIVLTNIPDIGHTPNLQATLGQAPAILHLLTVATNIMNDQIAGIAKTRNLPVVDLHDLNEIAHFPVMVGGVDVHNDLYAIDGFHPSTIG